MGKAQFLSSFSGKSGDSPTPNKDPSPKTLNAQYKKRKMLEIRTIF
jgi:hypothetical protein